MDPVAPVMPTESQNPWTQQLNNDQAAGAMLDPYRQQTLSQVQGQMSNYAGDASQYPAMANAYGLGQSQPIPGAASNPGYLSQPITVTVPDTASRGFNPWSLTGEANARGK